MRATKTHDRSSVFAPLLFAAAVVLAKVVGQQKKKSATKTAEHPAKAARARSLGIGGPSLSNKLGSLFLSW
jgi:hypothetical protein